MFKANDLVKYRRVYYVVTALWDNDAKYLHVKTLSGMHGALDAGGATLVGRNYKVKNNAKAK